MKTLSGIAVCLLLLAANAFAAETMRVHFIDVGQGAATLVEFPCAAMMIDTGGEKNSEFDSNKELLNYLDEFFESRPDLKKTFHSLVLTHPHMDHTRGVKAVLAKYRILNTLTNGMETGSGRYGQIALHDKVEASEETTEEDDDIKHQSIWVKSIERGKGLTNEVIDPIQCGSIDPKITALWGRLEKAPTWSTKAFNNANNHSVTVRIDFGQSSLLVAGDIQEEGIAELLAHYKGSSMLDVDVVQVSHHGSHNATTLPLMKATTPKIAVIGMGSSSRHFEHSAWGYGHPRNVAFNLLVANVSGARPSIGVPVATGQYKFQSVTLKKAVYGTGWDGTIVLAADTKGNWRIDDRDPSPGTVNLNTASIEQLVRLPMIGHARAEKIVAWRMEHGPFNSVDDLAKISGIKSGTVNALKNLVRTD